MAVRPFPTAALRVVAGLAVVLFALAGCTASSIPKAQKPIPAVLKAKMGQLGMKETSQILVRIFKEESEMEIWKERADGQFGLLTTYSICKWSGALGPKKAEGDRQAPEGFYTVTPAQMNPNSSYYLSFNIGYPNAYDRSLGRTGSNLMVHGACSSSGCYSMTDADAGEIFALARDSFRGGQRSFQIQAYPFRMTPENLAKHRDNPNMDFWKMLKVGYDTFELTHKAPKVDVCDRHYVFNADAGSATFNASAACPAYTVPANLTAALQQKQAQDDASMAKAVAALEQKAADEATQQQIAAERKAEEERRAAERAANPSIITRLLNTIAPPEPPQSDVTITRAAPAPAAPPPMAAKASPVPKPKVAPPDVASNAPSKTATVAPPTAMKAMPAAPRTAEPPPLPAATTTADTGKITPAVTPQSPPVGTFVKKQFLWPGDDDPGAAGEPSG